MAPGAARPVGAGPGRLLAALSLLASTFLGLAALAFTSTPRAARQPPAIRGARHLADVNQRRAPAASFGPADAGTGALHGLPGASLAALLLAAAAAGRSRARSSTARRAVSERTIQELQISDVPFWFRPKISIGMARRDNILQAIANRIESTFFIMAFNKDAFSTSDLEEARTMFPPTVMVRCLKNSLVRRAMLGTQWEEFGKVLKGGNMFVFVDQDTDLKPTIEAWLKIEKKFERMKKINKLAKKAGFKGPVLTFELRPLVGGVMRDEWKVLKPMEIVQLKDMPTKTELIARIAGSIKQVTQKIAVSVKQVPQKLAIGTKKVVEKMEEDGKDKVADVVA
eukprot:CAMPEP_0168394594 /NCGR_PEP_ID=MMETSP0228-20121227/19615_1 /TAXON_ID=133427 /ORGANISM="Protoceratium reticulatum, Strain CCCM 535 (=CCMP 1889)" /LENGTH=339 /DNA_ID=CAMNT_0008408013 /DNA_START=42 /DNA_END=1061 /DNA_ORIENTATION=-